MHLRLNLWLGMAIAAVAFVVGSHSGPAFMEGFNLVNQEVIVDMTSFTRRFPVFNSAVGTLLVMSMMSISLTVFNLIWFGLKFRAEYKKLDEVVDFDLGTPEGVNLLVVSFVMTAFVCGFFSPFLEIFQIVMLLTVAALPTILQLIDFARHQRKRPRNPTKPGG